MNTERPDFIHPNESTRFLKTTFSTQKGIVHDTKPKIVICDFFLFSVIYCTSDSAPGLKYIKKNKRKLALIIWDRLDKKENTVPGGWFSFGLVGTRADLGILYVQQEYKKNGQSQSKDRCESGKRKRGILLPK